MLLSRTRRTIIINFYLPSDQGEDDDDERKVYRKSTTDTFINGGQ